MHLKPASSILPCSKTHGFPLGDCVIASDTRRALIFRSFGLNPSTDRLTLRLKELCHQRVR